jgi:Spy/CpxP family protein refolding chaperone
LAIGTSSLRVQSTIFYVYPQRLTTQSTLQNLYNLIPHPQKSFTSLDYDRANHGEMNMHNITKKGEFSMKIKPRQKAVTGIVVVLVAASFLVVGFAPSMVGAAPRSGAKEFRSGKHWKRHHAPAFGIWKDQQMITQLEISEAQVQQLRDADFTSREKHLALKTQLDQLQLQMEKAFSLEAPDKKAILQLAEKVAGIKGKMFVQKIEARLDLRSILTSEQIKKLELKTWRRHQRGGSASGLPRRAKGNMAERYDMDCQGAR